MIDTGAEANLCRYNCLPESKWDKLKIPIIVKGFNNEGSLITYKARNVKAQITYNYPIPNKILKIRQIQGYNYFSKFDCKSGFYHLKLEEESNIPCNHIHNKI